MVTLDDLRDDEYYQFFFADIQSEVEKYGKVKEVVIPRPLPGSSSPSRKQPSGVGKIFVIYENIESSALAQKALSFRKYYTRCVLTTFYDEDLFLNGHLDGTPTFNSQFTEENLIEISNPFADDENSNPQNRRSSYDDGDDGDENNMNQPSVSYNEVPPPQF
jgi:hypothetical protein